MTKPNTESRVNICTSSDMAISSELKNFKIPCLTKLDKLIRLHPDLTIDNIGPLQPEGRVINRRNIGNKNKSTTKTRSLSILLRQDEDEPNSRLNNLFSTSSSGIRCDFDAIFCGKESAKAPEIHDTARPSSRSSVNSSVSKSSACVASSSPKAEKRSKVKRNGDVHRNSPTQSCPPTTTRASRFKGGKRNKQLKEKKPFYLDMIDTNHMLDETIVTFLPEFCQKAKITVIPDNPLDLCEKFTIPVPHLDLSASETPPHDKDDEMLSSWKARAFESIN